MQSAEAATTLAVSYFDGTSARARAAVVRLQAGVLFIEADGMHRQIPACDVQWPERTRHGLRVAHFSGGGSVQCADAAAWDRWSRASGQRESIVVAAQQSWRWVLASLLGLVVVIVALQRWGLPIAAQAVVAVIPQSVDRSLGGSTMRLIDDRLMRPSRLPAVEQERLRAAFGKALQASPAEGIAHWQLVFRQSRIGPNAFALPGGTLVMTDELVELVGRDEQVLVAVLAHEMGHLQHRHGLRMLVQAGALSALAGLVLGDFSTLLASLPVLLGQASYSRQAEREADAAAVGILKAASISPAVMVKLFDKLEQRHQEQHAAQVKRQTGAGKVDAEANHDPAVPDAAPSGSWLGIAFASHPADAERIRFFNDAAAR